VIKEKGTAMTTSEGIGPAELSAAEAETAPIFSELSPSAAAAAGDPHEIASLTGSAVAPDDPQQLEQEIERTRQQPGDRCRSWPPGQT
jgi:hypothetical protein